MIQEQVKCDNCDKDMVVVYIPSKHIGFHVCTFCHIAQDFLEAFGYIKQPVTE